VHLFGFIKRTYHLDVPIVRNSGRFILAATLWEYTDLNKDCFTFTIEPSNISEAISRWASKDIAALLKPE